MAGVKGMHEGRKHSPAYAEKVRARIKAGGIVKRLQDYILGKIQMDSGQVTAALGLLRKVVPDMASVEHTGEVSVSYAARIPGTDKNAEQWQQQHSPVAPRPTMQ